VENNGCHQDFLGKCTATTWCLKKLLSAAAIIKLCASTMITERSGLLACSCCCT